jgi:hypothetical protein
MELSAISSQQSAEAEKRTNKKLMPSFFLEAES